MSTRLSRNTLLLSSLAILVVLLAFLDYFLNDFRVSSSVWSALDLQSLKAVRDHIFTVAQIIAVLLLLVVGVTLIAFARLLFRYLSVDDEITVLPFETAAGEDKLNGRAIRDLFTSEWQSLRRANDQDIDEEVEILAGLPAKDVGAAVASVPSPPTWFMNIAPSKEPMTNAAANIAVVGVGQTTVSIGQLLVALRTVWPSRRGIGPVNLAGSLQRTGQLVSLAMRMETSSEALVWEVSQATKNEDEIRNLVKDLAFKVYVAMDELWIGPNSISANTWMAFKYLTEARDAYKRYRLTESEEDLEKARLNIVEAVKAEPDYGRAFGLIYHIGLAYSDKDDSKAEEMLRFATALNKDVSADKRADAFANLGWVQIRNGDLLRVPEAMATFREAIQLDPEFPFALANLGVGYDLNGHFDKAIEYHQRAIKCQKAIERNSESNDRYYHIGWSGYSQGLLTSATWLFALGYYEEAERRCQMAIKEANGSEPQPPHLLMSTLLVGVGRFEEALEQCDHAVEQFGESTQVLNQKAWVYLALGQDDEAQNLSWAILEQEPKDADAWYRVGMIKYLQQDHEAAIHYYKKACSYAPEAAAIHTSLASVYRKTGRTNEYNNEVATAQTLLDNASEDPYTRACFESVCGNADKALKALRVALERRHVHPTWVCRDPDLDFIGYQKRLKVLISSRSLGLDTLSEVDSKVKGLLCKLVARTQNQTQKHRSSSSAKIEGHNR